MKVVNLRREPYDVYIGRPGKGLPGPLGNPFIVGKDGTRAEVIAKHMEWIRTWPNIVEVLKSLKGKRLGCFYKPRDCHGDNYVKLAKELGI